MGAAIISFGRSVLSLTCALIAADVVINTAGKVIDSAKNAMHKTGKEDKETK